MIFEFIMDLPFTRTENIDISALFSFVVLRMFCIISADFEKVEFVVELMLEKYGYLNYGFLKILYRFQQGSFVHYF